MSEHRGGHPSNNPPARQLPKLPKTGTASGVRPADESPTAVAIKAIQREAQLTLLDELIREMDPYNYWDEPESAAMARAVESLKDKRREIADDG